MEFLVATAAPVIDNPTNWGWIIGGIALMLTVIGHIATVSWFMARLSALVNKLQRDLEIVRAEVREDIGRVERTFEKLTERLTELFELLQQNRERLSVLEARLDAPRE